MLINGIQKNNIKLFGIQKKFIWFKKNSEFHKQDIKDYIDKVSQNEWESFSDLFKKINEIREILFDDTNWKLSKCSCCYWLKNYYVQSYHYFVCNT